VHLFWQVMLPARSAFMQYFESVDQVNACKSRKEIVRFKVVLGTTKEQVINLCA